MITEGVRALFYLRGQDGLKPIMCVVFGQSAVGKQQLTGLSARSVLGAWRSVRVLYRACVSACLRT